MVIFEAINVIIAYSFPLHKELKFSAVKLLECSSNFLLLQLMYLDFILT